MLPKKLKVSKRYFPVILQKGKVYHSPHLSLRVVQNNEATTTSPLFSFVVSGKISKKATERNALKRRGYSLVRKYIKDIYSNHVCVFYFKKNAKGISSEILDEEIGKLLKTAKVL